MNEENNQEAELRLQALHLALGSSGDGEPYSAILERAQAYLDFMKGTPDNG